jgi:hypothetical protein
LQNYSSDIMLSHLTPDSLAEWIAAEDDDPAMAKLRELTVDYVSAQGGLTLDVWRLYMGHWFGSTVMMSTPEAARELGISESLALNIVRSTDAVIIPRWRRTPEFVRSISAPPSAV